MKQLTKNVWHYFERIIRTIVIVCLHIVNKELDEAKWTVFVQYIKFGIIGISNIAVSYAVYVITLFLLNLGDLLSHLDYIVANVTAFVLSVIWSFYWNNKYVFELKSERMIEVLLAFFKMFMSYAFVGIILNNVLSYMWIDVLNISKYIAPLINSFIGLPINFALNKLWAFKENK